jgi:hypothetical protein
MKRLLVLAAVPTVAFADPIHDDTADVAVLRR